MQPGLASTPTATAQVIGWAPSIANIGEAECAIGVFDGVHLGHRFLIESMCTTAHRKGVPSVVVTFDRDPDELFCDVHPPCKLLSNEDRLDLLAEVGADYVLSIPFVPQLARLSYDEFLEQVLGRFMVVRGIHVGYDFKLGEHAVGTVSSLAAWGAGHDCEVHGYSLLTVAREPVTATRVRELLAEGDVETALLLLNRPFYIKGLVVEGRHEGTGFGFPTANVQVQVPYASLPDGVYAGYAAVDGQCLPAAINVGYPPTFEGRRHLARFEPHILDFSGNLYGRELAVSFIKRLRGPVKFPDVDSLIAAVNGNIEWTRENLVAGPAAPQGYPLFVRGTVLTDLCTDERGQGR